MKGDFSRFTFDATKHYARVLMQQGRVQLDADWNEQVALLLYRLETLTADLIGPFGGPTDNCGFTITPSDRDLQIAKGRYYVGGLLCENDRADVTYLNQPFGAPVKDEFKSGAVYLVYLDAWEQYVSAIEDSDMREPALGGVDTGGRSRIVWRVRTLPFAQIADLLKDDPNKQCAAVKDHWDSIVELFQPPNRGFLKVKAEQPEENETDPCIQPPTARFRGQENQLYRVEIHSGGKGSKSPVKKGTKDEIDPALATFKWSRENGSVTMPVASASGQLIKLLGLSGDPTLGLKIDDWVELIDDTYTAQGRSDGLLQVKSVDAVKREVTVKSEANPIDDAKHPFLRRWDQKRGQENKGGLTLRDGAAVVVEDTWLTVEDGIQIRFQPSRDGNVYRPGDYWYIPARTVNEGKISWPDAIPPCGVMHRYAPLAIVSFAGDKFDPKPKADCVMRFDSKAHFG